jgi:hypothetical protein
MIPVNSVSASPLTHTSTHKHERGGDMVILHSVKSIQPHLLCLDLTNKGWKLLCHTEGDNTHKSLVHLCCAPDKSIRNTFVNAIAMFQFE